MVPGNDTALAVTDTGGPGIAVAYLKGRFATHGYRRRTLAEPGAGGRTSPTTSEPAPHRSARRTTPSRRPSGYGAVVAAHWAGRNPDHPVGAVLADGAFPCDWLGSTRPWNGGSARSSGDWGPCCA
ncbi:hypothetical protein [Streptomyces sp. NPDC092370]|uniref:hypothetical protein n=1 Tax=Streptomyces sp. NPDC092370 TaxID=3366016 RepID=UPI0037FA0FB4